MRANPVALCTVALLTLAAAVWSGCAGRTVPSVFYLLSSDTGPESTPLTSSNGEPVSLLLGPISLPAYLERTQIVSRTGRNRLWIDEFHRWAEPLPDGFYRVLAESLSTRLATDRIARFDRRRDGAYDYQVAIDITRFDTGPERTALLAAFWVLYGKDGQALAERRSVLQATSASEDVDARVAAQNETLRALGLEIADAILRAD